MLADRKKEGYKTFNASIQRSLCQRAWRRVEGRSGSRTGLKKPLGK
jgi:hypothetical protein